jgi:CRP-like cAMP-binding protein
MASPNPRTKVGNRLLDALPIEELNQLRSLWEVVSVGQAEEICHQGGPLPYVLFPVSGIYSTIVSLEDGQVVEASTVGNEGVMGLAAILGLEFSPKTATTPVPGHCLRLTVAAMQTQLKAGGNLRNVLHRYAIFALRNAYQMVACNTMHSAQERLCRWLLTSQDRIGEDLLTLTHEFLAQLLGVRRQTVTVIAGTLQAAGLIRFRRGEVRIMNRSGLEASCCECYNVTRSLYERIVHAPRNQVN